MKPTSIEFFAGSGLVTEGLKKYFQTIWANDICYKKARVYCANHDKRIFHLGSIENIHGTDVPTAVLSWGSFPCQDLSLAGNMGGLSNTRSGLVWHWLRVMDEMTIRPPIVVAENVIGLVSASRGEHYRTLHDALIMRGYKVGAIVLDASCWVPQSRKRIFVIAVDRHIPTQEMESDYPVWCHNSSLVKAAEGLENWVWWNLPKPVQRDAKLEDIVDFQASYDTPEKQDKLLGLIPERHHQKLAIAIQNGKKVFPGYKRIRNGQQVLELRFDNMAGCLRTPEGGSSRQFLVIKDNGSFRTRLLTVKETAALMGAPKTYKIPGTYNDGYKAMGDAVAVPVSRYLAEHLLYPLANSVPDIYLKSEKLTSSRTTAEQLSAEYNNNIDDCEIDPSLRIEFSR